jgi:hypothetical protein
MVIIWTPVGAAEDRPKPATLKSFNAQSPEHLAGMLGADNSKTEILDNGGNNMPILRFLFALLVTAAVLPASTMYGFYGMDDTNVLYQFQGTTANGLSEMFTYQPVGPIIMDESIPVSDLTSCNECDPLGYVEFDLGVYANFELTDVVGFPDANGSTYDYYFPNLALTYDGSYETIIPGNTATLNVSGAPPIPEPNEWPALAAVFIFAIGMKWYRLKLKF